MNKLFIFLTVVLFAGCAGTLPENCTVYKVRSSNIFNSCDVEKFRQDWSDVWRRMTPAQREALMVHAKDVKMWHDRYKVLKGVFGDN